VETETEAKPVSEDGKLGEVCAPGELVGERYRLSRFLGEGGMGSVWAATHSLTGKEVALKILKGGTNEHRKRFVQEARVAAAIRHPNVVDVHDVVELRDGSPVLVMDLLEGELLSSRLAHHGPLALEELGTIALQILGGMGAAHAVGVIHRDIKPENIFLVPTPEGAQTVKLLDFGIAKLTALTSAIRHTAALTQTGSVLGTPMYMAPEQVFGEKSIDHRADIWSLGVVMYECLTGECPILGDNVGQIFKSISQRSFPPITDVMPSLNPHVAELIDAMMASRPEDRPESARAVAERLSFALDLEPPSIAEPRWLPGAKRNRNVIDPEAHTLLSPAPPPSRRRWGAIASVTLLAATGYGALFATNRLNDAAKKGIPTPREALSVEVAPPNKPVASARTDPQPTVVASAGASNASIDSLRPKPKSTTTTANTSTIDARPEPSGPGGLYGASPY
jgi:eukaryotic-like serine/threonine-protein kinase